MGTDHGKLLLALIIVSGIAVAAMSAAGLILANKAESNQERIEQAAARGRQHDREDRQRFREIDYQGCVARQRLKAELRSQRAPGTDTAGRQRRLPIVGCSAILRGKVPQPLPEAEQRGFIRRYLRSGSPATLPAQ